MTESQSSTDAWRDSAACKGMSVDDFFPVTITKSNIDSVRSIYAMCAICPVATHCLYEAIASSRDGIWGHTTYKQRQSYVKHILNNNLENFSIEDCTEILKDIKRIKLAPNAIYKKAQKKVVYTKPSNQHSSEESTDV
jgi:hypothetical protein